MTLPPLNTTAMFLGHVPPAPQPWLERLDAWVAQGWLRPLDRQFAAFLAGQAPDASPWLLLAAALASHQLGRGHVCLDLAAVLADAQAVLAMPPERSRPAPAGVAVGVAALTPSAWLAGLDLSTWCQALHHASLVEVLAPGTAARGNTPLVCCGPRLYLRRCWQQEWAVRTSLAQRLAQPADAAGPQAQPALRQALAALFPTRAGADTDWQKVACALAARQQVAIITGGPGTGKTTTVVRLLAVLQHLALAGPAADGGAPRPLRIRLAAPTGKAAARLSESIAGAVAQLPLQGLGDAEALRQAIPTAVSTVHRLLGSRPDSRHFRHDARHPLPLDVLVVDEASMLDLEMTAALLAALPPQARLILLGDKDQLASVEAGAVLGDLCQRADAGHYTAATADWLAAVAGERLAPAWCDAAGQPLDQAVVKLRTSHRFHFDSGIGRLAQAIHAGDVVALRQCLASRPADLSQWHLGPASGLARLVLDGAAEGFPAGAAGGSAAEGRASGAADASTALLGPLPPVGYRHYLSVLRSGQPDLGAAATAFDAWAHDVLLAHRRFQLLCAVREGPQGVAGLNLAVAGVLRAQGLLGPDQAGWCLGRPVLMTRNDPGLGLMNGDVGITLALPQPASHGQPARWSLRVVFASALSPSGLRWVLPSRLRAVETVFAMTVHKSQGSEFSHAALVLPAHLNPVLTRELVYTAVTRARHWCTLAWPEGGQAVLEAAVQRRVQRAGGLRVDDPPA